MSDFDKININNTSFDVKDSVARQDIANLSDMIPTITNTSVEVSLPTSTIPTTSELSIDTGYTFASLDALKEYQFTLFRGSARCVNNLGAIANADIHLGVMLIDSVWHLVINIGCPADTTKNQYHLATSSIATVFITRIIV